MKHLSIFTLILLLITCCSTEKRDVKVACLGDSITEGFGIKWQADNAYPAQLARILGNGYEVINFGRSSTTMMRSGDFPYQSAKEFSNLLRYKPDIVIIKLGTNDAKLFQWNDSAYSASYQQMIDTLQQLPSKPQIMVCLPVPAVKTRWQITDSVIVTEVIPAAKRIAEKNNLKIIDLHTPFEGCDSLFIADGIHPNARGAAKIAEIIAQEITITE
jgi:alpha-L-fucosidase 2